jgi:hypothetical protein
MSATAETNSAAIPTHLMPRGIPNLPAFFIRLSPDPEVADELRPRSLRPQLR